MKAVARAAGAAALAVACALGIAGAAETSSHLDPAAKKVLTAYVGAIKDQHYAAAFGLLSPDERSYFHSAGNFESIFKADDLHVDSFKVIGSRSGGKLGYVGLVSENVRFLDHAHDTTASATVTVPYGLVHAGQAWAIKDPFHPWKAFRPDGIKTTVSGLEVTVRKVSFFTGRIDVMLAFANVGEGFVTVLPYGRSVLRDGHGGIFLPLATKVQSLTDKTLYEGLRLAADSQYTGSLTFLVPQTARPAQLQLTIAPALRDGADEPFEVALPQIAVPNFP